MTLINHSPVISARGSGSWVEDVPDVASYLFIFVVLAISSALVPTQIRCLISLVFSIFVSNGMLVRELLAA